jgi:hypothetical protein
MKRQSLDSLRAQPSGHIFALLSASVIHGYRPEAVKRNAKHGIRSETVSGLVYCRSRGTVSKQAGPAIRSVHKLVNRLDT